MESFYKSNFVTYIWIILLVSILDSILQISCYTSNRSWLNGYELTRKLISHFCFSCLVLWSGNRIGFIPQQYSYVIQELSAQIVTDLRTRLCSQTGEERCPRLEIKNSVSCKSRRPKDEGRGRFSTGRNFKNFASKCVKCSKKKNLLVSTRSYAPPTRRVRDRVVYKRPINKRRSFAIETRNGRARSAYKYGRERAGVRTQLRDAVRARRSSEPVVHASPSSRWPLPPQPPS